MATISLLHSKQYESCKYASSVAMRANWLNQWQATAELPQPRYLNDEVEGNAQRISQSCDSPGLSSRFFALPVSFLALSPLSFSYALVSPLPPLIISRYAIIALTAGLGGFGGLDEEAGDADMLSSPRLMVSASTASHFTAYVRCVSL